jgi:hypothetical protein
VGGWQPARLILGVLQEAAGGFTAEWEAAFRAEEAAAPGGGLGEAADEWSLPAPVDRRGSLAGQSFLPSSLYSQGPGQPAPPAGDHSQWFQLFADLDPLANPDSVGQRAGGGWEGGC